MKKTALLLLLPLLTVLSASAQDVKLKTEGQDPAYVETIKGRSQKIVDKLGLADKQKAENVLNIVCNRYFKLNDIHEEADKAVKEAKEKLQGQERDDAVKLAEATRDAKLYKQHFELEGALSLYLDEAGITAIKDGMTYGVVDVTYKAYCDMIPSLKDVEKAQIMAWLKEAREFAMDAANSKAKHGWFGKYKGRINNYLSARGYNIQQERQAWEERIKARQNKK